MTHSISIYHTRYVTHDNYSTVLLFAFLYDFSTTKKNSYNFYTTTKLISLEYGNKIIFNQSFL